MHHRLARTGLRLSLHIYTIYITKKNSFCLETDLPSTCSLSGAFLGSCMQHSVTVLLIWLSPLYLAGTVWLRLCEERGEKRQNRESINLLCVCCRGATWCVPETCWAVDNGRDRCVMSVHTGREERGVLGINLPFGTGAKRSGSRHNKSYVTLKPPHPTRQDTGNV